MFAVKRSVLTNRPGRILMVLFTIAALLFVRTLALHTHGPHDHHQHSGHTAATHQHQHHAEIHLAVTDIDDDAHDVASEIDLATKATLKNIKFSDPLLAVLTLFIILLILQLTSNRYWRSNRETPFASHRLYLRPALRAPPF